jgi:CheY-like chemotaxis protein
MPETNGKLLVVDDDPIMRISICVYLTELGYQVRTAEHGLAGLAEIQTDAPAILLSDLEMPVMSGFELLSEVRRRYPAIQTIAMSATVCADAIPANVVADAFFQKGSLLPCLLQVIESLPRPIRRSPRSKGAMPIRRADDGNGGRNFVARSSPGRR